MLNSLFNRKPVEGVKDGRCVIRHKSSVEESCRVVFNFLKFGNELLRIASE